MVIFIIRNIRPSSTDEIIRKDFPARAFRKELWMVSFSGRAFRNVLTEPPKEFRRSGAKGKDEIEYFRGLEVNYGELLLIYFIRRPDLEALGVIRSFGT